MELSHNLFGKFNIYSMQDFVREIDPDIIIGYNICKFDLPYLIEVLYILVSWLKNLLL